MDYSSKLTQLLQQLEVETGITFTVADSTLDEAETLAKVRDFLSFYQTRDNRNLFLSRFFLGQLSPEEILRGKQRFHIEESTLRVLFLLECKQPYDPAVISVLSNLNASGADMIVELDSLHIAVIRCARVQYAGQNAYIYQRHLYFCPKFQRIFQKVSLFERNGRYHPLPYHSYSILQPPAIHIMSHRMNRHLTTHHIHRSLTYKTST